MSCSGTRSYRSYRSSVQGCVILAFRQVAMSFYAVVYTRYYRLYSGVFFVHFLSHFYFPASGQAVVSSVVPSPPRYVPSVLSHIRFSIPTASRSSSNISQQEQQIPKNEISKGSFAQGTWNMSGVHLNDLWFSDTKEWLVRFATVIDVYHHTIVRRDVGEMHR